MFNLYRLSSLGDSATEREKLAHRAMHDGDHDDHHRESFDHLPDKLNDMSHTKQSSPVASSFRSLPRHPHAQPFFRPDKVIVIVRALIELNPVYSTVESAGLRGVVIGYR